MKAKPNHDSDPRRSNRGQEREQKGGEGLAPPPSKLHTQKRDDTRTGFKPRRSKTTITSNFQVRGLLDN
jgi:hypothetical protein